MINKAENYELALSTSMLAPQGIFNATEVNILDKTKSAKLPKILKPNTTFSSLKPSKTPQLALEDSRPKSSWNSFLKRRRYLGNLSRQSSVSTALIENIKKRIDQQVNE